MSTAFIIRKSSITHGRTVLVITNNLLFCVLIRWRKLVLWWWKTWKSLVFTALVKTYILGKLLLSNTGPGWKTVTFIFQENRVLLVWKWLWMVSTDKVVLEFSSFIREQPWGKTLPKYTEIMWEWKCLFEDHLSEDRSENVDSELSLAYWLANWPLVNYRLTLVYNRTPKFQWLKNAFHPYSCHTQALTTAGGFVDVVGLWE